MRTPGLCQNKVPAKKVITEKPDLDRGCGGLPGYYPPINGNRPEILFDLYKLQAVRSTTSRRRITLADIAYLLL